MRSLLAILLISAVTIADADTIRIGKTDSAFWQRQRMEGYEGRPYSETYKLRVGSYSNEEALEDIIDFYRHYGGTDRPQGYTAGKDIPQEFQEYLTINRAQVPILEKAGFTSDNMGVIGIARPEESFPVLEKYKRPMHISDPLDQTPDDVGLWVHIKTTDGASGWIFAEPYRVLPYATVISRLPPEPKPKGSNWFFLIFLFSLALWFFGALEKFLGGSSGYEGGGGFSYSSGGRKYQHETSAGQKYWEDEDGNREYEGETLAGQKYREDSDGHRVYEGETLAGREYREDEEGRREYAGETFTGRKYWEDEEGNRTYEDETLMGQKYEEKE